MANKFTRFLKDAIKGALNPKGNLGNFQHATRVYVDNTMRLAPRTKFMYYVKFEIDTKATNATVFNNRKYATELGYLIKTTQLPSFEIDTQVMNQYNRKKLVYKNLNYNPITMTFHDDNAGIMNAMWAIYLGTYFADRHQPTLAHSDTKYRAKSVESLDKFRYGLDSGRSRDLFKSISIYTMSRKRYLGYTLINPRIKSWSHGDLDNAASDTLENTMTIEYETVQYSAGKVFRDSPKGFATLHYDSLASPLSAQGGGTATLLGAGGVVSGVSSLFGSDGGDDELTRIFGNPEDGNKFGSAGGFLGAALTAINTAKNLKALTKEGVKAELLASITSPGAINGIVGGVSGLVGSAFSKNSGDTKTPAAAKTVVLPRRTLAPAAPIAPRGPVADPVTGIVGGIRTVSL
jgi:hypothetical protein